MDDYKATLRRLAVRDDRYIEALLQTERAERRVRRARRPVPCARPAWRADRSGCLTCRVHELGRGRARAPDASYEEIVGTLIALLPIVGVPRVVSAAPNLGLALGYDVAEALEVA